MEKKYRTPAKYHIMLAAFLCIVLHTLTSCGQKEEYTETQFGIDGYVYMPKLIATGNTLYGFNVIGDELYYYNSSDTGKSIQKFSLPDRETMSEFKGSDFSTAKTLLKFPGGRCVETGELREAWNSDSVLLWDRLMKAGNWVSDSNSISYAINISDYTIDEENNIYCIIDILKYNGWNVEESRELLCRYGADGQWDYRIPLDEINVKKMIPYKPESLFLLTDNEILEIGADGSITEKVSIEEYNSGRSVYYERLYGEAGEKIYYIIYYLSGTWEVKELVTEGGLRLRDVTNFNGNTYMDIQGYRDGNLYYTLQSDNILYSYNAKENTASRVLRWEDSDIYSSSILELWPIGEEQILVWYYSGSKDELYLLNRTPVEELPEKELIVLASLSPDLELQKAVIEFNRQSEKYHCIIERYGAGFGIEDAGAELRLDVALLSSAPPDILDVNLVDIYKYAEKDILEDLSPYVSDKDREDFLDGLLEGYTIGGKLVCIPMRFMLYTIVGRDSQTGTLESWGIEDVYTLMEKYPECTQLVNSGYRWMDGKGEAEGKGRDYMLEEFFSAYYLERFIDWETGECSFDSAEFRELLIWLEEHVEKSQPETSMSATIRGSTYVPEYALLMDAKGVEFNIKFFQIELQFGEKIRLLGYPTLDGKGRAACRAVNKLSMVSHSLNKEGAWNFLEYYLSRATEDSFYLPTRKSLLRDTVEKAVAPPKSLWLNFEDGSYEYAGVPQYMADALMEQIENLDFSPMSSAEEQIISIVTEEAESYFNGDKKLEDVTAIIQNRVQLLLKEIY